MKDQTAMMELIEWLNTKVKNQTIISINDIKYKATELLDKEREQIAKAYDQQGIDYYNDINNRTGQEYYETKYGK